MPGDEEHLRDVRGRQAAQEQLGDLAFPAGQAVQVEDERRQVGGLGRQSCTSTPMSKTGT
jgi:hypothetical protein